MYDSFFNDVSDAIALLQHAQQETEKIFMSGNDGEVYEIPTKTGGEEPRESLHRGVSPVTSGGGLLEPPPFIHWLHSDDCVT
jgi:hypothetical protein